VFLQSPVVERLVDAFRRLPGVGKRSAERMAIHLLSTPGNDALELSEALREAKARIGLCSTCNLLTDTDPCSVCSDDRRDTRIVCVVEQPLAALAIERGGSYRGRYHVLHGVLNPLEGVGPSELRLDRLFNRVREGGVSEVILATNTTAEGEATALYLARQLGDLGVNVTRIAHGVPMGGGVEYADEATLAHAIEGRTRL
jgi:recombination protein RecR